MKNQKEISPEEQKEIDKINMQESGVDKQKTEEKPKKQKHTGTILAEGLTDGGGTFIPFENGKLNEAYKEQTKGWKNYKRYSDGTVEIG